MDANPNPDSPETRFQNIISALYGDDTFADLTITCKGKTWKVHRSVVCPQSDFFNVACRSNFKEARDCLIDFPEEEEKDIELLIFYFYHQYYGISHEDYRKKEDKTLDINAWTITHGRMFSLACKYGINSLKTFAVDRFRDVVKKLFLDAPHGDTAVEAVRHAYRSAELPQENTFLAVLFDWRNNLVAPSSNSFKQLLDENHEIAAEAAKIQLNCDNDYAQMPLETYLHFVAKVLGDKTWECPTCAPEFVDPEEEWNFFPNLEVKERGSAIRMTCSRCEEIIVDLVVG